MSTFNPARTFDTLPHFFHIAVGDITPSGGEFGNSHGCIVVSLVAEVQEAGVLVIGLPIYNFSVPAAFKAWIDQIARVKVTFRHTDKGPIGLLDDKKAYVIITSGGTQLGSEIDFVSEYIHHILGFIGIKDVTIIDSSAIGRDEKKVLSAANKAIRLSDKGIIADQ